MTVEKKNEKYDDGFVRESSTKLTSTTKSQPKKKEVIPSTWNAAQSSILHGAYFFHYFLLARSVLLYRCGPVRIVKWSTWFLLLSVARCVYLNVHPSLFTTKCFSLFVRLFPSIDVPLFVEFLIFTCFVLQKNVVIVLSLLVRMIMRLRVYNNNRIRIITYEKNKQEISVCWARQCYVHDLVLNDRDTKRKKECRGSVFFKVFDTKHFSHKAGSQQTTFMFL